MSLATNISSTMPIVETSDEFFTSETRLLPSAGNAIRIAWGTITNLIACHAPSPIERAASCWPFGTGLEPRAEDFGVVRRGVDDEGDEPRREGRQPQPELWQTEVDDEDLDQERGITEDLHVRPHQRARDAATHLGERRQDEPQRHRQHHGLGRDEDGQARPLEEIRQAPPDRGPLERVGGRPARHGLTRFASTSAKYFFQSRS